MSEYKVFFKNKETQETSEIYLFCDEAFKEQAANMIAGEEDEVLAIVPEEIDEDGCTSL